MLVPIRVHDCLVHGGNERNGECVDVQHDYERDGNHCDMGGFRYTDLKNKTSITGEGITLSCGKNYSASYYINLDQNPTFTAMDGYNFKKIVISTNNSSEIYDPASGWTGLTWSGTPAKTVPVGRVLHLYSGGGLQVSITFTLVPDLPDITASATDVNAVYDGNPHEITVNVTAPASGYTIKYGTSAGTYDLDASPAVTNVADSKTVYYKVTADNYNDFTGSARIAITKAAQSAPTVSSTDETVEGKSDGTITGVTAAMEYKLSTAAAYTPVTGTTVTGLAPGTYDVRYAESANYSASPASSVVIDSGEKITVDFNTAGGTPVPASQQYTYGQTVSKPDTDPEKTGYTFKFWSADGETEYDFSTPLTANITLKAIYQVNSYTVTFETDGGSAEYYLEYGETIADYIPTIGQEGYTFLGWDKEIPETMPAEDLTFTAQWKINQYTITFDTNGGTEIAPITQDYGTAIKAPAIPTRQGYHFTGWNRAIPTTMPAENLTIYALWSSNTSTYIPPPIVTTDSTTTTTTTVYITPVDDDTDSDDDTTKSADIDDTDDVDDIDEDNTVEADDTDDEFVGKEQLDETDDDFDELTDDEGDFDDDFAEDQTDSGTDDDDRAAVDAAVTTDESNPNTGAPLAGIGVFAALSFFAAAAAYTANKRKNK